MMMAAMDRLTSPQDEVDIAAAQQGDKTLHVS